MTSARDAVAAVLAAGVPGVVALAIDPDGVSVASGGRAAPWLAPDAANLVPDPVTEETSFDLASLTKLVVALAAVRLAQRGRLDLDQPLDALLPEAPWAEVVTAHHLLSHTSGLPAVVRHATGADRAACEAGLWQATVDPVPGAGHRYSCVGYQALGVVLERLTGTSLPRVLEREVLTPLGMTRTTYGPDPARCAATEWTPERGLVRGAVHDHAAWVMTGAGNAGLFGTASDIGILGTALLDGAGLLDAEHHRLLVTDRAGGLAPYGQGLGPRIGDLSFLPGSDWVGHTGFTGTSLAVHPPTGRVRVLLTNAVHPRRGRIDMGPLRRSFA